MRVPMSFGAWLRRCRTTLGLTQRAFATHLGYAFSTYRKLEAEERRPTAAFLTRLADYLHSSASEREILLRFGQTGTCENPQLLLQHIFARSHELPQASLNTRRTILPHPPTRLIGRDSECHDLTILVQQPERRLITLVGPPGVGKTHLAIHTAARLAATDDFAAGIIFVSLASLTHTRLVYPTIASTMGITESQRPFPHLLHESLHKQRLLLVLDNLEHLPDIAALLVEFLDICPGMTILATSRAPLNIRAEQQFLVSPLPLPNLSALPSAIELAQNPAIALFVERAQAIQRTFDITETNSAALAALCIELDGLPLALELAAVHIKIFSPTQLLERITDRLALLADGPRDLPPRQQSLRTAITQSYQLLNTAQQQLFSRLSIFVGGATLAAITAICSENDASLTTARTIADLMDQSLLCYASSTPQRVTMLETIHTYAYEQLIERGEQECMHTRHATYYDTWATTHMQAIQSAARTTILLELEQEQDNLRATLRWYFAQSDTTERGARLAATLCDFWARCGHLIEGRAWLEESILALQHREGAQASIAGHVASNETAHTTLFARVLHALGVIAILQGDYARAKDVLQQSFRIWSTTADLYGMGEALYRLGVVSHHQGDLDQAQQYCQTSLTYFRSVGARPRIAAACFELGLLAAQGHLDMSQAAALLHESLDHAQNCADPASVADARFGLGLVAYLAGDEQHVRTWLDSNVLRDLFQCDRRRCIQALQLLAAVIWHTGDPICATRAWSAAYQVGKDMGLGMPPAYQGMYDEAIAQVHQELGTLIFTKAWESGRTMPLAQAVDEICAALARTAFP